MDFLSDYAFDVMNTLFKARSVTIPIHPSLHTKVHPNFVQVADDISRELVRFNRVERGAVRLAYCTESGTLTLLIANTKTYKASSEEEDDPDQLFTTSLITLKPWKTQEECLDELTYKRLLAHFRTMCFKVLDAHGDRIFYFPRSYAFQGGLSLDKFLLEMEGFLDSEEYRVRATASDDRDEWITLTFHLK
jgi:hypothetical protein